MAIDSLKKPKINFPVRKVTQEGSLSELAHISDGELIELIINPLNLQPERHLIAKRQLEIYFNRLSSQPKMRALYLEKVRQLIQLEKNKGKKK